MQAPCGGEDDPGDSTAGTATYSIPTAVLDRALSCKGGTENLDGAGEFEPILLVPGTTVTREQDWGWNYWAVLPDRGFEVCWVQLPDLSFGDIQISAEYIARAVELMQEASGEEIDVLGHSQGGASPRWVVKYFPAGAFVDDQIGFAAPNHGVAFAEKQITEDRGRAPEAVWQLHPESDFLAALNRGDESPGAADYTSIYSKTDPLVQPTGTQDVEGGANILLQDSCPGRRVDHGAIVGDDVTYRLVIDALTHPGPADPERADVDCARERAPGIGKPGFGRPQKGVDQHIVEREPPLEPYVR